ncbi:MAG: 4Fe-4S binding protein [Acidobacteriota bacterium]
MAAATATPPPATTPKKRLIRRFTTDHSQRIRHGVQWFFVALNLVLGLQFYLWARYCERGGTGLEVSRPSGVEGWLPIAGMMNTKLLLVTHHIPLIHPAAMFLFLAFLAMSLLLKKSFCSWICPVGTLSEHLWKLGRKLFRRTFHLPKWADIPLRGLKYLLLGFFTFFIAIMSADALADFMTTPYGLIADIKMLNFFRELSLTGLIVLAVLAGLSLIIQNFWCRYLCPYGAVLGLASLLSPIKIRRDPETCIDCGKCNKACPANLPIDSLVQINSVECSACMACISACPAQDALQLSLPPRNAPTPVQRWSGRALTPSAAAFAIACIFFGIVLGAKATGHWQTHITRDAYLWLVPNADAASHPM